MRKNLVFGILLLVFASPLAGELVASGGEVVAGRYVVVFEPGTDVPEVAQEIAKRTGGKVLATWEHALDGALLDGLKEATAAELAKDPRLAWVEPDMVVALAAEDLSWPQGVPPPDPPSAARASLTATGSGVNVYVVDTGILAEHSDFESRALGAFDAVGDGRDGTDCHGHGTLMAGIAAGAEYGMAPKALVFGVRVLDCEGGGTLSGVLAGIDWVSAHHEAPAVAVLGFAGPASPSLDAALSRSSDQGVAWIAAAGDAGADACTLSPGGVPEVLTVAAADATGKVAPFANRGDCVELLAAAVRVPSTSWENDKATGDLDGSAAATARVAGLAASLLEASVEPCLEKALALALVTEPRAFLVFAQSENLAAAVSNNCCQGSSDPCCGSTDPCCGSNDPCCGSSNPCCGVNCNDGNACTTDSCVSGSCQHQSIQCNDGNVCNGSEGCNPASGCTSGTPLQCDDGNACNGAEGCDPASGCTPGTPLDCDDDNVCNGLEGCDPASGCTPGTPLDCDDDNVCNGLEGCDAIDGCTPGTPLDCDDDDLCNGLETCDPENGCQPGTPVECDDGTVCTEDLCDPETGLCDFPPTNEGGCCEEDGSDCTKDICEDGACIHPTKDDPLPISDSVSFSMSKRFSRRATIPVIRKSLGVRTEFSASASAGGLLTSCSKNGEVGVQGLVQGEFLGQTVQVTAAGGGSWSCTSPIICTEGCDNRKECDESELCCEASGSVSLSISRGWKQTFNLKVARAYVNASVGVGASLSGSRTWPACAENKTCGSFSPSLTGSAGGGIEVCNRLTKWLCGCHQGRDPWTGQFLTACSECSRCTPTASLTVSGTLSSSYTYCSPGGFEIDADAKVCLNFGGIHIGPVHFDGYRGCWDLL